MINAILETAMRSAINLDENKNADGSINWNFVDADSYADCHKLFKDSNEFYQHFNTIADKIEPGTKGGSVDCSELYNLLNKYPNAVEQIEILKKDYLGAK
jgi:hypothetical protein|tara:strand:+ start:406 stop:705 length:300 start_codon:yes stop_codon:yes gene_type:complete